MNNGKHNKNTPGLSDHPLLHVCQLLNRTRARYLVVGGMACNLHGLIRATNDIDVFIPQSIKNTEKILGALSALSFGIARELDAVEVTNKPFTIIGDSPRVDLLTVAQGVSFDNAAESAERVRIRNVTIPFVDLDTLLQMKQTGRLQDLADIERLQKIHKK